MSLAKAIIAQATDKIKANFDADRQFNALTEDFRRPRPKFKVGDIVTDGSFSCRRVIRIETRSDSLVYYFEGILKSCPEDTIVTPLETTQPLLPLDIPLEMAKYKVGDYATALVGNGYQFACRRIVRIERNQGPFHYFFEGIDTGYPEENIVLADETVPQLTLWDGHQTSSENNCPTQSVPPQLGTTSARPACVALQETRQVLSQLGPERKNDKTTWLRVGQALHAEHGVDGLPLWQEWTVDINAPSTTYTAGDCQTYFAKFRETSAYCLGTLQRWASEDQAGGYWGANQVNAESESENLAEQQAPIPQDFDESHDASSSDLADELDFNQRLVATQAWRLNYEHYGNCFGLSPELLYWANLGARFTLLKDERDAPYYKNPKDARKQPTGKGWQERPHTAQQAQAHLETGKGVGVLCGRHSNGLICLDIDEIGLDKALEVLPMLANMPYVAHAAKPNRGKFFFYAPPGTENRSYGLKINGKRVIFFEILSDGKQAVIPPSLHPSDAQYTLFNAGYPVPTLTGEQILAMWDALLSIAPVDKVKEAKQASREQASAKKAAKKAKWKAERASTKRREGVDFDTFDWDAFTKEIADNFDLLSYAEANFSGQTRALRDGGIRIIGNGGLIVSEDQWCIHSENSDNGGKVAGGGCFQLVSYVLFGTDDAKANWSEVLKEAAKEAGVAWPTFKRSKQDLQASHFIPDTPAWVIEFARTLKIELVALTLHEVIQTTELGLKYISEVYDINSLGPGLWVVQAPTEKGKTTATVESIKNFLIIAVPTQSLARQVEKDKGLQAIYENIEPVFGAVNRFVSTYDSVAKIIARAAKKGIDISHWTLVIDECHHLASDGYRKEAIESLGMCIKQFERVIALSATPTPIVPFFEGAPLIRFTAPQIEKPLYFATCTDYANAIYQALREAPRCICHLNNKTAIKALIEELALRGIKGLEFTSDSKDAEHHCNMITNQTMPDCDVLFVTSLYDDGYNFFDKDPYILLITAQSSPSPEQIEQISARLRKQRPIKTILVSKATKASKAGDTPLKVLYPTFDYAKTLNRELETATELAAIENEAHKKRVKVLKRTEPTITEQQLVNELVPKQLREDGAYRGLKWDGTQYVADNLGVQMATFAKWRHACNANRDLMIHALKPYGFVHAGDWKIKEDKKETAQSRARQAVSKERLSEERREAVAAILTDMQGFAHAELILTNQGNKGHSKAEYEAASLMMALVDSGITDECAKELILNSTMTAHAIAGLKGKIRLQRIRLGLQESGRYLGADVGFYRKLFEIVQIGDILRREKLDEIYGRIFADNESVAARVAYSSHDPDKQKRKRVRLINAAFDTKRTKVWNDGHTKRIDVYEVIGLSPIEVTFDEPVAQEASLDTEVVNHATETSAVEANETINQMTMNFVTEPAKALNMAAKGVAQKADFFIDLGSRATTDLKFNEEPYQDDKHDETYLLDSWKTNDFVYQPTTNNPYGW